MKLHLPSRLRSAVIACITAVAAVASTVGTGVLATGAIAYTLSHQQAQADVTYAGTIYTWTGTSGDFHSGPYTETTYSDGIFTKTTITSTEWNNLFGKGPNNVAPMNTPGASVLQPSRIPSRIRAASACRYI